ncbi:MAG: FHA domain-containing protein [Vulcanimicrobiota bacterium]
MSGKDYMETLKDGIGFMSKVASVGVSKLSKQIKGEEKPEQIIIGTGLFYQRHIFAHFGDMIPRVEYLESASLDRLGGNFVKKLVRSNSDKSFVGACYALLFGDFEVALQKLREVKNLDPQYTDSYFVSGALNLNQKRFKAAQEDFSKCRLIPHKLGQVLSKFMPSFRLSLCLTENLTFSFFPDVIGLNLLLAITQRNEGKLDEAIVTLEQIFSVIPNSIELIFFLSCLYFEAGWNDKIINLLKDVVPENNLELLAIQLLVESWMQKKSFNLAEGVLQKALEAEEADPYVHSDIRMLLGEVVTKIGRTAEGHAYKSRVMKIQPGYKKLIERLGLKGDGETMDESKVIAAANRTEQISLEPEEIELVETLTPDQEIEINTGAGMTAPMTPPVSVKGNEPGQVKLVSEDGKVNVSLPESLVIGREEGDLVMEWDTSASRKHARIFFEHGQVWVEDLESTNGTWINRHRIRNRRVLNFGDKLLIGQTEFHLE